MQSLFFNSERKNRLFISLLLIVCIFYGEVKADTNVQEKNEIYFDLPNLQGKEHIKSKQFHGKLVLLSFFEPECGWCYRQMKVFNHLQHACPNTIAPIMVGINGNNRELRKELRRAKVKFSAAKANRELIDNIGQIPATPWTLIINSEGKLIGSIRGYFNRKKLTQVIGSC